MVPVYADLRLPLTPDAEIMPQPGYNLYNALFAGTSGNPSFRLKENTRGTLYCRRHQALLTPPFGKTEGFTLGRNITTFYFKQSYISLTQTEPPLQARKKEAAPLFLLAWNYLFLKGRLGCGNKTKPILKKKEYSFLFLFDYSLILKTLLPLFE